MVENKLDKTKSKNWVDGDTFALKIHIRKNTKYTNFEYFEEFPNYEGKYLILIYTEDPDWDLSGSDKESKEKMKLFRAKLFDTLPTTLEEIEQQEYIKVSTDDYDRELFQFPDIVNKLIPDKYNIIYQYIFELYINLEKTVPGLKYIGNYTLTKPNQEYIPDNPHQGVLFAIPKTVTMDLINKYITNNLKRSPCLSMESVKLRKENLAEWIEHEKRIKKIIDSFSKMSNEEIREKLGIENEIPHESETYVGGKKDFKE